MIRDMRTALPTHWRCSMAGQTENPGYRAVPSLRYILNYVPVWTYVRATNPIEQLTETDEVPAGGYTWDGRYNSLHAQAMLPFLSPAEMDNRSVQDLAKKLSEAQIRRRFSCSLRQRCF